MIKNNKSLFSLGVAFFSLLIIIFILWRNYQSIKDIAIGNSHNSIKLLWEHSEYDKIIKTMEKELEFRPLRIPALIYMGFSYFYRSLGWSDEAKKLKDLNNSIVLLRKSLIFGVKDKDLGKIYYILGKAYYYKGVYYIDLAEKYLKLSIEKGYYNSDSYELLAQAFSYLGRPKESIKYFDMMYQKGDITDRFLLAYANDLERLGEYEKAIKILQQLLEISEYDLYKYQGLLHLGKVYYNIGNYKKAKEILNKAIKQKDNEEGHYILGEVYEAENEHIKARSEWRKAIEINPKHLGALQRLTGNDKE